MTKIALSRSMRKLPISDRIELVDELLHSVAAEQSEIPIPAWQKKMLEEDLNALESNLPNAMSHAEFKRNVNAAIRRMELRGRKARK